MKKPAMESGHGASDKASIAGHARHYTALSFALVPIPYRSKAPTITGWPDATITDPDQAERTWTSPLNIGLEHGRSCTGTLDIDAPDDAALALAAVGIDLDAILRHPTPCIIGKNGRKPLYDLSGLELPYAKLTWPHPTERLKTGKPKQYTVLELRAGHARQDLLPPSIHPDTGNPYRWHPHMPRTRADLLPPPDDLLELWRDPERLGAMRAACPWQEVDEPPAPRSPRATPIGESVIDAFNERHTVREILEQHGYQSRGKSRYLSPHSTTGLPGVAILTGDDGLERAYVHHTSDPLADEHAHDAFGIYCQLEHGGDLTKAVRTAAEALGMAYAHGNIIVPKTKQRTFRGSVYARLRGWK